MGNDASLTMDDIKSLSDSEISQFTKSEISTLYKRFQQLDKTQRGFLTVNDMGTMHELILCPLWKYVLKTVVDIDKQPGIKFEDFVRTLWILCEKSPNQLKIETALKIFGKDDDGILYESDLYNILNILGLGIQQFSSQQLKQIVKNLIKENAKGTEDYLSVYEFVKIFPEQQLVENLTIYLKLPKK